MISLGSKILQYCRLQRDADFAQLAVYELRRVRNNELIIDPATDTKEGLDLIKAQTLLGDTIFKLRKKFLNGDDSDKTYAEVLDAIELESLEFSPEQILFNEKVRQSVMDYRPYGQNYNGKKYSREDLTDAEEADLQDELNNTTEECETHFKSLGLNEIPGS